MNTNLAVAGALPASAIEGGIPSAADCELPGDNVGNTVTPPADTTTNGHQDVSKGPIQFEKISHRFAHMKQGAQRRFEGKYKELANTVRLAWMQDAEKALKEFENTQKHNRALAETKRARIAKMAAESARDTMKTVFSEWRNEIDRIISVLGGWLQDDGMVLFGDGSTAKMPKGLWISPEDRLDLS